MMDRHNMVGGVGLRLPPIFGSQSEIDLLLKIVEELDDRLAALMMPPPIDIEFNSAFMGFAQGTYTRSLLAP